MISNKYSIEQMQAMRDLCEEFKTLAHTMGERERVFEALANLLNKNCQNSKNSIGKKLKKASYTFNTTGSDLL